MSIYRTPYTSDELYHYGVKGMKWGVRRYRNRDGSLTSAGKQHYGSSSNSSSKKKKMSTAKKVAVGAAVVAGTVLAAYGAKKLKDVIDERKFRDVVDAGQSFVERVEIPRASVSRVEVPRTKVDRVLVDRAASFQKAYNTYAEAVKKTSEGGSKVAAAMRSDGTIDYVRTNDVSREVETARRAYIDTLNALQQMPGGMEIAEVLLNKGSRRYGI